MPVLRSHLLGHLLRGAKAAPWEARGHWKFGFSTASSPVDVPSRRVGSIDSGRGSGINNSGFKRRALKDELDASLLAHLARVGLTLAAIATFSISIWVVIMTYSTSQHWKDFLTVLTVFTASMFTLAFGALRGWRGLSTVTGVLVGLLIQHVVAALLSDVVLRFSSNTISFVMLLPVLGGVAGGGRLVAYCFVLALVTLVFAHWLSQILVLEPLDFSVTELKLTNAVCEIGSTAACVMLLTRFLHQIERVERDSNDWGAMLARDIRTPMHGLLGLLEDFKEQQLSARDSELVGTVQGCARMMLAILDTMLGAPNVNAQLVSRTVDLRDLAKDIKHLAQSMAWRKSQTVDVELIENEACPAVSLRVSDFFQVLGNLISNAVKFSPAGSQITVRLRTDCDTSDAADCVLHFEVVDAGPGVPPKMRNRIFKPFDRGAVPASIDGIGLGLNIVREIVSTLSGSVQCLARGDGRPGAKFSVRIPCSVVRSPNSLLGPDSQDIQPFCSNDSVRSQDLVTNGRILIVDDNALNLLLLVRFLQQLGMARENIVATSSGEAALALVAESELPFVAAILDMVLPGMNGIELARRLAKLHLDKFPAEPRIVFIGASASLTPAVNAAWVAEGVACQFTKPFQKAAVADMLSYVCDRRNELERSATSHVAQTIGHATVVEDARLALQEEILFFNMVLLVIRITTSLLTGRFSLSSTLFRVILLVVVIVIRTAFRSRPQFGRCFIVLANFVWMVSKISWSGCGGYVGYVYVPLITGLLYSSNTLAPIFGLCVLGHISFLLISTLEVGPEFLCRAVSPMSRTVLFEDVAGILCGATGCILIYLSLMAIVQDAHIRWTNTLSHDLRAPLHGVFASITELQESKELLESARRSVRIMKTCARSLLAVTDTVLAMAVNTPPPRKAVRLGDLQADLKDLAGMVLDQQSIGDVEIGGSPDTMLLCERSALTYALSQLVAAVPLLASSSSSAEIQFAMSIQNDDILEVAVQERGRPPSAAARNHDPSLLGDSASALCGSVESRSTLVRVVQALLLGEVHLRIDDSAVDIPRCWRFVIRVPVTLSMERTLEGPMLAQIHSMTHSAVVVLVDDSSLNLRIGERLLSRCGVRSVQSFVSSAEAITAIESGVLDSVDVFFIDLNMPVVTGIELAQRACAYFSTRPRRPALVACTSDASTAAYDAVIRAGMQQILVKPFGQKDLLRVLSAALGASEKHVQPLSASSRYLSEN